LNSSPQIKCLLKKYLLEKHSDSNIKSLSVQQSDRFQLFWNWQTSLRWPTLNNIFNFQKQKNEN
jgi:hypothetical protein